MLSADGQFQLKRGFQWRQAECRACGIAIDVRYTLAPRRVELTAGARPLLIDRAACALADFPFKAAATRGFLVGSDHRYACGVDLHHKVIGHRPPEEAHSPQKKDTRKCEQQAPQLRHGLASDMGVIDKKSRMGCFGRLAILILPWPLGRGASTYIFVGKPSQLRVKVRVKLRPISFTNHYRQRPSA